ncbi:MAG: imelysin family protein, partial [Gammaproteobacteria bacterium]
MLALVACTPQSDVAAQRAVLDGYRRIAAAAYADSLQTAQTLHAAARKLVDAPGPETLDAARAAWIAARRPYAQTEALRFGNWVVDDWEAQVNAWPLDEGLIDYVDDGYAGAGDNLLAHADLIHADAVMLGGIRVDTTQLNPALLAQLQRQAPVETAVAVGYHAVEFLLWGQDRSATGPGARPWTDYARDDDVCTDGTHAAGSARSCRRRGDYLLAVTQLLVADLLQMQPHWSDAVGSYGMRLVRGDPKDGLRRVLYGMATLAAAELAGERIEVALQTRAQEEEQDCFSDQTHASLRANLQGIANFWRGRYARSGGDTIEVPALRTLVAASDAALSARIDEHLRHSIEAADAVVAAVETGAPVDQQILGGGEALARLAGSLRALGSALEAVGPALRLGPLNPASATALAAAPGGATTAIKRTPDEPLQRDAFSQPAANLSADERARFFVGNSFFEMAWVAAPSSTVARDGLGPLYN